MTYRGCSSVGDGCSGCRRQNCYWVSFNFLDRDTKIQNSNRPNTELRDTAVIVSSLKWRNPGQQGRKFLFLDFRPPSCATTSSYSFCRKFTKSREWRPAFPYPGRGCLHSSVPSARSFWWRNRCGRVLAHVPGNQHRHDFLVPFILNAEVANKIALLQVDGYENESGAHRREK